MRESCGKVWAAKVRKVYKTHVYIFPLQKGTADNFCAGLGFTLRRHGDIINSMLRKIFCKMGFHKYVEIKVSPFCTYVCIICGRQQYIGGIN